MIEQRRFITFTEAQSKAIQAFVSYRERLSEVRQFSEEYYALLRIRKTVDMICVNLGLGREMQAIKDQAEQELTMQKERRTTRRG